MNNLLFKFDDIYTGTILKRPSKICKTPYVADVLLEDTEILGHSPSLGCCGLADKDCHVLLSKLQEKKNQTCSHRVEIAIDSDENNKVYIGINPKLAETIAENCLKNGLISNLSNIKKYHREVKVLNSRFDFAGNDENGKPFVLEIKNVPLADYVDVPKKEKKNYINLIKEKKWNEKIAYFPDGYRKTSKDVVSPRALKHIQELEQIAKSGKVRAILCFVIQRTDVCHFQTSVIDMVYKDAVYNAWKNGVEITTIQVEWNQHGECYFVRNNLPISLKENEFI
jgi:DNA-binding sugar fermentation-stimulating protein